MPDVELTDEIKQKLKEAGALAYQLKNKWKYVPRVFREKDGDEYLIPKEHWPVFTLRCLDGVSASLMEDKLNTKVELTDSGTSMTLQSGRVRIDTCSKGIIGFKNFKDSEGKEIKFKKDETHGGISGETLKYVSPKLQIELANAISEQRTLTDDELLGLE